MTAGKRPRHPMPPDIQERLEASETLAAYGDRPPYQRNDYLIWIDEAKTPDTREKRIRQMIGELKRGDVYMKMTWKTGTARTDERLG
jgi:uncharacterized protein YdeI (YjbR/CyaY-like superfamily)